MRHMCSLLFGCHAMQGCKLPNAYMQRQPPADNPPFSEMHTCMHASSVHMHTCMCGCALTSEFRTKVEKRDHTMVRPAKRPPAMRPAFHSALGHVSMIWPILVRALAASEAVRSAQSTIDGWAPGLRAPLSTRKGKGALGALHYNIQIYLHACMQVPIDGTDLLHGSVTTRRAYGYTMYRHAPC